MKRELMLYILESKSERVSLRVEGILGLVKVAQVILDNPKYKEIYLTECSYCCCRETSYRLFSGIPEFSSSCGEDRGRHADSGNSSMIAKCYDQPKGLAEVIAKKISTNAKRLTTAEGVPEDSIIFKLK